MSSTYIAGQQISSICVSIGIPTYNRGPMLRRAIESVLRQTHGNLELVISDNASTDDTQQVCEEYARNDSRIRYIRQQSNIGMTPNFNAVLEGSSSDYYMWLTDDDWIDDRYVEHCLRELLARPDYAVVCGINHFYDGDVRLFDGDMVQITGDNPCTRTLRWYRTTMHNAMFYGIYRREYIANGFGNVAKLGEDVYLVAAVLFAGKGATIDSVALHRSRKGRSETRHSLMALYGATCLIRRNQTRCVEDIRLAL